MFGSDTKHQSPTISVKVEEFLWTHIHNMLIRWSDKLTL